MINEAELRRLAARAGVDPMVQDLDYSLGWFLAGLFSQAEASNRLVFKGGTCLRKAYFADYRFSEDLDFTLTRTWAAEELLTAIELVQGWSEALGGPNFAAERPRLEVINDEYGKESLQARIYYRGPLRWGGAARAIQLDLNRDEIIVFPRQMRMLTHPYSDAERLGRVQLPCYALEEMLTEKLRAIGGQRRFAISRDLYDIYQLTRIGLSSKEVHQALPAKCAAKGLSPDRLSLQSLLERKPMFAADWQRSLSHLLPARDHLAFEDAWGAVIQWLESFLE